MKYLTFLFCIITLLGILPVETRAVSEDFTFRISVGDDLVPPSTPILTAVTPVSFDQLDVSWSTATDNWIFGGYVLLRDGTPIATTTLTSYSDTGLTPETTYSYSVYAFDAAGNISTTSNSIATTTVAVPVVPATPPPTETGVQSTLVTRLVDLAVTTDVTRATLRWTTNTVSRYLLRWGRTDAYTGGYVSNDVFQTEHLTTITDLEPGTRYEYELIGYTPFGRSVLLERGSFVTEKTARARTVGNVERLMAVTEGADVRLTFRIPSTEPDARVRVVRSHLGFPTDLTDGVIVYEGRAETVRDRDAFARFARQFYTVFVIGSDGLISSGAVAVAYQGATAQSVPSDREVTATPPRVIEDRADEPMPEIILPLLEGNDIVIRQADREYTFLDELIELSAEDRFTLTIMKTALPRHLKSIVVTISDPSDHRQRYAFLLRLNPAGTAYEATIEPIGVLGESRILLEVYDFDLLVVGRYAQPVHFVPVTLKREQPVVFPDAIVAALRPLITLTSAVFGVLGLIAFIIFLWRRRTEDND